MSTESVISTFSNVKFIQGLTPMTQENWQAYFGTTLKTGVYKGLNPKLVRTGAYTEPKVRIYDGVVYANGIRAEIETQDGYTDIGTITSGLTDRFIVVRVHLDTETAELVQISDVNGAPGGSPEWTIGIYCTKTLMEMTADESYLCTRNEYYWDIPIFYQSAGQTDVKYGRDLRRKITLAPDKKLNPDPGLIDYSSSNPDDQFLISASNLYQFSDDVYCLPDFIDIADGAVITFKATGTKKMFFPACPFTGAWLYKSCSNFTLGDTIDGTRTNCEIRYTFSNPELWTENYVGNVWGWEREITDQTKVFRITFAGIEYHETSDYVNYKFDIEEFDNVAAAEWGHIGGLISTQGDLQSALALKANVADVYAKSEVYTKAEADALLADKADADDVYTKAQTDTLLSAKADAADVYDKTDVYTKAETDTLLNGKSNTDHTHGLADASITGILPASKGGTGVTSLDALRSALDALINREWYVNSTLGSDSNDGKTAQTAFATIQKAVDVCCEWGMSTITVESGTYYEEVEISGKNITLTTTNRGKFVISRTSGVSDGIRAINHSFVKLNGDIELIADGNPLEVSNGSSVVYVGADSSDELKLIDRATDAGNLTSGMVIGYGSSFSCQYGSVAVSREGSSGSSHGYGVYAVTGGTINIKTLVVDSEYQLGHAIRNSCGIVVIGTLSGNYTTASEILDGGIVSIGSES